MPSYKELLAQKDALETQLAEMRSSEIAGVIERIQGLMTEYGLTVHDIAGKRRRGRPADAGSTVAKKSALPPKYRDPKTGQTWSGRGRAPAWLGKNRNRFLIAEE